MWSGSRRDARPAPPLPIGNAFVAGKIPQKSVTVQAAWELESVNPAYEFEPKYPLEGARDAM